MGTFKRIRDGKVWEKGQVLRDIQRHQLLLKGTSFDPRSPEAVAILGVFWCVVKPMGLHLLCGI